jgi:transcription elongation factor Elf1
VSIATFPSCNINYQSEKLLNQEKLARSNEFLELYKQGLSYQDIGDKYGLSRERVRQILKINPAFHEYIKERDEAEASAERAKVAAEREKAEQAKQELYLRSLAVLYPERVAQLWDYEKNGELKPEEVFAGSSTHYIWLKCPYDGHSWKKIARDIAIQIWERKGTSGCPVCAGKTKKSEKQLCLLEVYSGFVSQYWNYEKNNNLGLDPAEVTLGSNKKVWFKCPHDGNEWQAIIAATVKQQWSKDNAGCRVCNGTDERKRGEWKRGDPIAVEFPDEIAKYWNYEKNHELKIDPMKVTIGSGKKPWFKCPIDSHEWQATITAIAQTSWKRGNSGCPACRGFTVTESSSLVALYPDYVADYWDYEKNDELGLYPDKLTKGSTQDAWFKCPIDSHEWKTKIGSITRASWRLGNSGCPRCGSGWSLEAIRQFVASLEEHIPNLTQAERYKIFEQSGVLGTKNAEGLKIVKDIIKGKLSGQKLRDVLQGKEIKTSEPEVDLSDALSVDAELQIVDTTPLLTELEVSNTSEKVGDGLDQLGNSNELPKVKVKKSLEFLNSQVVASADQEAIDFFIASRRNRIWAEVFEDESAVEGIEAFIDEGYGRQVRDQFLDEYNQAQDMPIPGRVGISVEWQDNASQPDAEVSCGAVT